MLKLSFISAAVASTLFLSGCQATADKVGSNQAVKSNPIPSVVATPVDFGGEQITLEQAMAHPDWLGRQPEGAYWGADSNTIFYKRKQAGTELRDLFSVTAEPARLSLLRLSLLRLSWLSCIPQAVVMPCIKAICKRISLRVIFF